MSLSPGRALVSAILASQVNDLHTLVVPDAYLTESEKDALDYIKHHVHTHGVIPDTSTLQEHVDTFAPALVKEPPSYYLEQLKNRHFYRTINTAMKEARALMVGTTVTSPMDAPLKILTEAVLALKFAANDREIVDFRSAFEMIKKEYANVQKGEYLDALRLGWDTPDNMCGGLRPGDVVSYVGRPGFGKTFSMLYSMHNAWWNQTKSVLLLSMEMIPLPLVQRLTAMHTHVGLTDLKMAELSTKKHKGMLAELKAIKGHPKPCWIVDGNLTASVEDLKTLCSQLEPDAIYVDGAYLLSPSERVMSRWDKVTATVEEIKRDIATRMGIISVLSYQFNRVAAQKQKAAKKGKKEEQEQPGLEDIGLSDAIGQVSSLVMGLLEGDTVENVATREVTIMKGRNGEKGAFKIWWDFMQMRFNEVPNPKDQEEPEDLEDV